MGKTYDGSRMAVSSAVATVFRGRNDALVPDHPGDVRGQEPSAEACIDIETLYGLKKGCTLVMGGERWYYLKVGTWNEEAGEKPCLWAYKYLESGRTAEKPSLLNVWRVE